jgi:hypothetical protein
VSRFCFLLCLLAGCSFSGNSADSEQPLTKPVLGSGKAGDPCDWQNTCRPGLYCAYPLGANQAHRTGGVCTNGDLVGYVIYCSGPDTPRGCPKGMVCEADDGTDPTGGTGGTGGTTDPSSGPPEGKCTVDRTISPPDGG